METKQKHETGNPSEIPVISLVGRPNVGKSTLFNRLTKSRKALVTDIPGTTRDRKKELVRWGAFRFHLVDTGGMGFGDKGAFSEEVESQIEQAVRDSDVIWMLVDIREGWNPFDATLYRHVVNSGKPHLILVNKADNPARVKQMVEFYRLGSDRLIPISASHGTGIDEALEQTAIGCPRVLESPSQQQANPEGERSRPVRVAFMGRPNVGKSSLINNIGGNSRMIVSPIAGTTREANEIPLSVFGKEYMLVDTAGIRRKARTTEYLEKIGVLQSIGALKMVDVAVLVLDGGEELAMQDAKIAQYIQEHDRAVVLAVNKWDLALQGVPRKQHKIREKEIESAIRHRFRFIDHAAIVRTNALDGTGMRKLFREIDNAAAQFQKRVQTADLNRVVQSAMLRFPPPGRGRSPGKVFYGLQTRSAPPTFKFFTSFPELITDSYTRFMQHQIRYHFGSNGSPIRVQWEGKSKKQP